MSLKRQEREDVLSATNFSGTTKLEPECSEDEDNTASTKGEEEEDGSNVPPLPPAELLQ